MKHIAVDIGNSSTKCGVMLSASEDRPAQWHDKFFWDANLADRLDDRPTRWTICSVNGEQLDKVVRFIQNDRENDSFLIVEHQVVPLVLDVDDPAEAGVDRLCAAAAAFNISEQSSGCVIVDIGTATTVDGVSADGHFLGGTIFPGIQASFENLAESTSALPLIDVRNYSVSNNGLGKSTRDAIATGVVLAQVGGIMEIVGRIENTITPTSQVFVTGGGAKSILSLLPETWQAVDDLVLRGILQIGTAQFKAKR